MINVSVVEIIVDGLLIAMMYFLDVAVHISLVTIILSFVCGLIAAEIHRIMLKEDEK